MAGTEQRVCRGSCWGAGWSGVCALALNPVGRWHAEAACLGSFSIHTVFAVLLSERLAHLFFGEWGM